MIGQNVQVYGDRWIHNQPEVDFDNYKYYGTVLRSMFSLLEIVIQAEGAEWRPIIEAQPELLPFYLFFIAFCTFGVMNVIIGVIVENMMDSAEKTEGEREVAKLQHRLHTLRRICDLCFVCDENGDGVLSTEEIRRALARPEVTAMFMEMRILPSTFTADDVVDLVDQEGPGKAGGDRHVHGDAHLALHLHCRRRRGPSRLGGARPGHGHSFRQEPPGGAGPEPVP